MSRIPPKLKAEIWERDNGDTMTGLCFVCNSSLKFFDAEMGHIVARANGGTDSLNNLKVICGSCNKSMGTQHMFEYKKKFYSAGSSRSSIDLLTEKVASIDLLTEQPINNDMEKKKKDLIAKEQKERKGKIDALTKTRKLKILVRKANN